MNVSVPSSQDCSQDVQGRKQEKGDVGTFSFSSFIIAIHRFVAIYFKFQNLMTESEIDEEY